MTAGPANPANRPSARSKSHPTSPANPEGTVTESTVRTSKPASEQPVSVRRSSARGGWRGSHGPGYPRFVVPPDADDMIRLLPSAI
ncbi:hypothetical protein E4U54_003500 [Claviceps lovelessii]|nr:hypothetical protein E4U54_003500 [Claviceps lovelessii]